jgi:hypothetical protein
VRSGLVDAEEASSWAVRKDEFEQLLREGGPQ